MTNVSNDLAKTILLNGPLARRGVDLLRQAHGDAIKVTEVTGDEDGTAHERKFAEADILVTADFDRGQIPDMPKLKLIHLPVAGLDHMNLASIPKGCAVCNVAEHEIGIAEYVMSAMLHFTVDLHGRNQRFKAGSWADAPHFFADFRPELAGKTLGCIGYGTISQAVARRAKAFGMRVMAVTRRPRGFDPAPDWLGGLGLTEALAEAADFLLVACPLNEQTKGLLGKRYLSAMKPSAVLINVARGPIVDETILYDALKSERIGGAVLDTWYHYPKSDDPTVKPSRYPFETLDNVIMTPHCSGWTEGLIDRRFSVISENINRFYDGRSLLNQVYPAPVAQVTKLG